MKVRRLYAIVALATLVAAASVLWATTRRLGPPDGQEIELRIPEGAPLPAIAASLDSAGLIGSPRLFALYARIRGAASELKAGRYRIIAGTGFGGILETLRTGRVVTIPLTIPEGLRLREVAPRIAAFTGDSEEDVLATLRDPVWVERLGVPGPTLEGYLFPETYHFSEDTGVTAIVATAVGRYRAFWGDRERALADSLGLTERQVVTLASIVEEEARVGEERAIIAGVYLNRLEIGMHLQADPTVQYALDEPQSRLLFRHIDQVADDPYNTYTHAGLPPGPIASPGEASLRAALEPAEHAYLFFVARADGSHVFTRTNREHINAINRIRSERDPDGP